MTKDQDNNGLQAAAGKMKTDKIPEFFHQFGEKLTRQDQHFKGLETDFQKLSEGWISKYFVVEVHKAKNSGDEVLCIYRTAKDATTSRNVGDITWDELMEVKRQVGRGQVFSIEVFPPDSEIIDTENVRHLFLITEKQRSEINLTWAAMKMSAYKDHKEKTQEDLNAILTMKPWQED